MTNHIPKIPSSSTLDSMSKWLILPQEGRILNASHNKEVRQMTACIRTGAIIYLKNYGTLLRCDAHAIKNRGQISAWVFVCNKRREHVSEIDALKMAHALVGMDRAYQREDSYWVICVPNDDVNVVNDWEKSL